MTRDLAYRCLFLMFLAFDATVQAALAIADGVSGRRAEFRDDGVSNN